jgi:hypothetical protein
MICNVDSADQIVAAELFATWHAAELAPGSASV